MVIALGSSWAACAPPFWGIFVNEPFDPATASLDQDAILLVATDEAARARALNGFGAAFVDPTGTFLIDEIGVDRMEGSAVWLEIGEDKGAALDHWLMAFDSWSKQTNRPITVAMTVPMMDVVTSRLDGAVEFVVAPETLERASAVNQLAMRNRLDTSVADSRGVEDQKRLRDLSDEVARIADTLARLSAKDGGFKAEPHGQGLKAVSAPVSDGIPDIDVEVVRATIRARRLRERFFDADYFADPAWDMLLDLLAAEIAQHRVPVSSLCIAAAVPATTALRWMKTLTDQGIFRRRADPHDGRRVFVELSSEASLAMRQYFAQVGSVTSI